MKPNRQSATKLTKSRYRIAWQLAELFKKIHLRCYKESVEFAFVNCLVRRIIIQFMEDKYKYVYCIMDVISFQFYQSIDKSFKCMEFRSLISEGLVHVQTNTLTNGHRVERAVVTSVLI